MYPVNAHTQRHVGTIIHHRQKLISALEYADQLQLERSGTYRERKIAVGQYVPLQPLTNSYTPIPYINVYTGESYTGQLYPLGRFNELAPLIMTTIEGILQPISANVIDKEVLVIRPPTYGDLHSYLKTHKRLPEQLSSSYFKQVMHIINQVHSRGIILRDLKLKKFHFTDPNL
jgi:serine/threonine protein kinase